MVMSDSAFGFEPLILFMSTTNDGSSDWIAFSTLTPDTCFSSSCVYDAVEPVNVDDL